MGKPVSIFKNKLLWFIVALLVFWAFPRPVKWAGKFFFAKLIPSMALIANIVSTMPLYKLGKKTPPGIAPPNEITGDNLESKI
jgi:hypothetical protein